jgi:3-phenylpropionate/cinnamic acid dioxygenase small subunit
MTDDAAAAIAAVQAEASAIDRSALEAFLFREVRLLDERRFRDWMGLFAEDGTYWVPAVADQQSPFNQVSLFYDDRDLMKTRVDRLEHPRIHIQTPPSRTAHLIGNLAIDKADAAAGEYVVTSTVIMVEHREDNQRIFAGRQTHRLRHGADGLRIVQKRVDLVNCDSAFEAMAVPI